MKLDANPNWQGGLCFINTLDDLLKFPEYCEKKRTDIVNRSTVVGECWEWLGTLSDRGRAKISIGNKNRMTARVAYVVFNMIPIGDQQVCHSCDNVKCVNPEHLWLGNQQQNLADMIAKGRQVITIIKGENAVNSKLKNKDVIEIRKLHRTGISQSDIARAFNVHPSCVSRIVRNQSWTHVEGEYAGD